MLLLRVFLTAFLIHTTQQLNNGLGLTPQMGTYDLLVFFFVELLVLFYVEKVGTVGIILDVISMKI